MHGLPNSISSRIKLFWLQQPSFAGLACACNCLGGVNHLYTLGSLPFAHRCFYLGSQLSNQTDTAQSLQTGRGKKALGKDVCLSSFKSMAKSSQPQSNSDKGVEWPEQWRIYVSLILVILPSNIFLWGQEGDRGCENKLAFLFGDCPTLNGFLRTCQEKLLTGGKFQEMQSRKQHSLPE